MKNTIITFICLSFSLITLQSQNQTPVDVTEKTIKIDSKSEEVLYYGFAEKLF